MKILLDPGHYGSSYNPSPVVKGYYESNMAWTLTHKLKTALERYGFEVLLTRTNKDADPELTARGRMAKGCDLFLSLHSNAAASESPDSPWMIHFYDDKATDVDEKSKEIAHVLGDVVSNVMGVSKPTYYTKLSSSDRNKDGKLNDEYYGVLHGAKTVGVPGVIIEHSFHTNKKATLWLMNDDNLTKLAEAEAKALADHYGLEDTEMKEKIEALEKRIESQDILLKEYKDRIKDLEDQVQVKWAYVDKNLPEWAAPTMKKLEEKGVLKGNDKNSYEMSYLFLRIMVLLDRVFKF